MSKRGKYQLLDRLALRTLLHFGKDALSEQTCFLSEKQHKYISQHKSCPRDIANIEKKHLIKEGYEGRLTLGDLYRG